MALRQQVKLIGQSFIETTDGRINKGNEEVNILFYIKVVSVSGDKNEITAIVNFKDDNCQMQKSYKFSASVAENAKNFIAQSYEHLKTLPEFAGAIDC